MLIYFPQWQGSGIGKSMKDGAEVILNYLDKEAIKISLSDKELIKKDNINGKEALKEQLISFKAILEKSQPKTLNTIGGDCGLEIIPVSYLASIYDNLGVIWFDAHADINLPEESPSHNFHGMPLRTLLGEGNDELKSLLFSEINASQIHYVGLRSIDKPEKKRIEKDNIFAPKENKITDLIDTLKSKNISNIYIHFDVDCLDPKSYKEAYFNVTNGITAEKAKEFITTLQSQFNVVGTSILESVAKNENQLTPIKPIINLLFNV